MYEKDRDQISREAHEKEKISSAGGAEKCVQIFMIIFLTWPFMWGRAKKKRKRRKKRGESSYDGGIWFCVCASRRDSAAASSHQKALAVGMETSLRENIFRVSCDSFREFGSDRIQLFLQSSRCVRLKNYYIKIFSSVSIKKRVPSSYSAERKKDFAAAQFTA